MSFIPRIVHSCDQLNLEPREHRFEGPPPRARPSDRLEPFLALGEVPDEFAHETRRRGVSFELAAVVVVERSLLDDDFRSRDLASLLTAIDDAANSVRAVSPISEAQRAYLRALRATPPSTVRSLRPAVIALPMRIIGRVGSTTLRRHLRADLLDSAFAWECAAMTAGQTMTEWAAFAAMGLLSSRR